MTAGPAEAVAEKPEARQARRAVEEIFDPYALMDRLDEEALLKEMEGQSVEELIYRFVDKTSNEEVIGLSKPGVDECCIRLMKQGQCIREEKITHKITGKDEDQVAFFQATCARYAVSAGGTEVRLDQVIGVKRQPLYEEQAGAHLSLDEKIGFGKHGKLTWRQALEDTSPRGGKSWLEWAVTNLTDERKREFVRRILDGEDVVMEGGRRFNRHWFEHGSMKCARNGRFRLIPLEVRHQVIEMAKAAGKVRDIQAPEKSAPAPQASAPKAEGPKLVTLLPGNDANWKDKTGTGWGGRLIQDAPDAVLMEARAYYHNKNAGKNARLIDAIDAELDKRREIADRNRPDPTDPKTFEETPDTGDDDDDLPF